MLKAAYKTLRLDRQAGPGEVRAAYVRLARRYPPEHFPDQFAKVQSAWRQLSLEEGFVAEFCARAGAAESPLELAALLWGDLPELDRDSPVSLESLADLQPAPDVPSDIDVLLDQIAPSSIKWRTALR